MPPPPPHSLRLGRHGRTNGRIAYSTLTILLKDIIHREERTCTVVDRSILDIAGKGKLKATFFLLLLLPTKLTHYSTSLYTVYTSFPVSLLPTTAKPSSLSPVLCLHSLLLLSPPPLLLLWKRRRSRRWLQRRRRKRRRRYVLVLVFLLLLLFQHRHS